MDKAVRSIGFSKYHFFRLFKQYTGFTYCAYICYRRIRIAERLLDNPALSITDVALQSVLPSISTFNRVFKQQNNCTPSEYRKMKKASISLTTLINSIFPITLVRSGRSGKHNF